MKGMNPTPPRRQHTVKLVDGTFDIDDAAQVLNSLLQAKIKFHSGRAFSNEERFGHDRLGCRDRVMELRKERERLQEFIASLKGDKDAQLSLGGEIELHAVVKPVEVAG